MGGIAGCRDQPLCCRLRNPLRGQQAPSYDRRCRPQACVDGRLVSYRGPPRYESLSNPPNKEGGLNFYKTVRADAILQEVATNGNLAAVGLSLGLNAYINVPHGTQSIAGGTIATTMEAILGAVYLDGGILRVRQVMWNMGLVPRP